MNPNFSVESEFLVGTNFSGRSDYLKSRLIEPDLYNSSNPYGIYIGEIPGDYLSGLAPTVKDEITLHCADAKSMLTANINDFLESISFRNHYSKNPFSLSGGEQSILAIISSLLLNPKRVSIDITLEQLNKSWRTPLFETLHNLNDIDLSISICDNRVSEYENKIFQIISKEKYSTQKERTESLFKNICISNNEPDMFPTSNLLINKLNFNYRGSKIRIIENCNYEFEPGIIYHLKGDNGTGKSTLSKLLCGVLKASSGNISVGKKEWNTYKYPGKYVGYSFQNPDEQLFSSTVRKELFADSKKINKQTIDFFIASFGLSETLEMHPAELPFVIRKRLAIAGTLVNERDWYILDEPTIGQDNTNMNEIANLVKLLVKKGKGVILISHSESFIECFDKVHTITLQNGKIES